VAILRLHAAVSWLRNDCTILAELSQRITQLQYLLLKYSQFLGANFREMVKSEVQIRRIPFYALR
jgi:hypothetical protein